MSKVIPITTALAAAMLAVPAASAQVTSNRDSAQSPWPTVRNPGFGTDTDTTFIRQALRGNLLEVGLGRMADSRATNSEVEDFAERMVSEHNSMNQEWATLARKHGMRFELESDSAGRETAERLEDLSGAAFDQGYMAEMIRLHEQDLAAFQRMGTSARDTEVRQLANSGATTIREHLALARQVGSRVGVSTTAGRAGGVTTTPVPAPSDDARRRTTVGGVTGDDRDERDDRDVRDERTDRDGRPALRGEDRVFVEGVLSDHLMHIRLAKRAQREAKNQETRRLAERMEKEFTNWANRWENFADRRAANVTSHLEKQHRQKLERLEKAEGRNYDRAYAAIVKDHLEDMVDDFREERQEKRPAAVGRLAKEELPVLRDLLERARRVEKQAEKD
jgi:putative membrane protein